MSKCAFPLILMILLGTLSHHHASDTSLPPESEYVTVNDQGQFVLHGERQRFWAPIGKLFIPANVTSDDSPEIKAQKLNLSRKGTDLLLRRFEDLGFNGFRLWIAVPDTEDYEVGDGSEADSVDYFLAKAKERGFRVWAAGLNRSGFISPENVNILEDPDTAADWQSAVEALPKDKRHLREALAKFWDPRLEALLMERMKAIATHTNKHTGLRWADDPVFCVWEISNEEWWIRKMVGGQWQELPAYWRNQLVARWNQWLLAKYGSEEALVQAWKGLLDGESLTQGTILFAPMAGATKTTVAINDAGAHALAAVQALKQEYRREDFSTKRGEDVLEFLVQMQLGFKQRVEAAIKSWGRSTALSPVLYDTGIGYEIQSQYLHQNADAVSHDAYINGFGPEYKEPDLSGLQTPRERKYEQLNAERLSANEGLWVNWLLKPPGIAQGVPWLEHNRVERKPFLVYETQIQQPAKYRADFPLRLAALASIQDWDWVSWHYFASTDDVGVIERPFDKAMDITTGSHPQGYHFTFDEVQTAMMRAAGMLWRQGVFAPAPNPTRFIYGRKSLFDPASMDYAGSYGENGLDMLQTTYEHGVRIQIDPTRDEDEVVGEVVRFEDRHTHNPYRPTDQILFDWKKGFLSMDAPAGVAWTGMLGRYGDAVEFRNGVVLRDVTIHNPDGIYEPISKEQNYIAFALYSEDGKPLAETKSASLSLVSTSFNTGFQLGRKTGESPYRPPEGTVQGSLPVLVARVGATIEAPALNGMTFILRDWHMEEIGRGIVRDGRFQLSPDQPVFLVQFQRQ